MERACSTPGPALGLDAATELPPLLGPLLSEICTAYLPYLHQNALAWRDGRRRFDLQLADVTYPELRAVQYRSYCRQRLQERLQALPSAAQETVERWLAPHGGLAALRADGVLPAGHAEDLPAGPSPPHCRRRPVSAAEHALRLLTGIGWNTPRTTEKGPPQ